MSYPKMLYRRAILKLVAIAIVLILFIVISSFFTLNNPTQYGIIIVFLLGFLYYPLVQKISLFPEKKIEKFTEKAYRAKMGWKGEEKVFEWLEELVGGEHFLKNAHIPNRMFDFDAIVIFEKGVVVLEVKNWTDPVRFELEKWSKEKEGKLIPMLTRDNPIHKFIKHTQLLREYLDINGLRDIPIRKAIIFVNGKVFWEGNQGSYIIKDKESLERFLRNTSGEGKCTKEIQQKIRSMFLCDKE